MNAQIEVSPKTPEGFEAGFTVEKILLSIVVVSTNKLINYDDSCAHIIKRELEEKYNGVLRVSASVLYDHTKVEEHYNDCHCGHCDPDRKRWDAYVLRRDASAPDHRLQPATSPE